MSSSRIRPTWFVMSAALLLVVLFAELFFSVRQNSQTFDESAHIYAGYSYWKTGDFGINPEHPPLAKMVATLPLLPLHLSVAPPPPIYFRGASAVGGQIFLYTHDADKILLRSRMAMSVFTFALALLLLAGAREMFGKVAAIIALLLFVFEPNVLANGALVTTDMALTAMLFATAYAFYRYTRKPTTARLLLCAFATGLALCVKHSALITIPLLLLLAASTLFLSRQQSDPQPYSRRREALRLGAALVVIFAIAYGMLWSVYGFRYAARPGGAAMTPSTSAFLETLHRPLQARMIGFSEQHHLLPESYLFGLTDVAVLTSEGRPTFLFGNVYPSGRWYYFPATFVIKSTIGFLLLLAIALAAAHLWRKEHARELLFLLLPSALYFATAIGSKLNIGHRHILPVYPFLIVLAAGGAAILMRRTRAWATVVIVLLALHVASSLHAYPAYLPYSNEVWGGPSRTWTVLSDANVGWESGLKPLQQYIRQRGIKTCWLSYDGPADVSYFNLPCKPLPTYFSIIFRSPQAVVPTQIQGPIFIGSQSVTGWGFGPADVNPYNSFADSKPDNVLYGEILIYDGSFNVSRLSALSHLVASRNAAAFGRPDLALQEALEAESLAPELLQPHQALSALYAANHQPAEASREYDAAMHLYATVYSAYANDMAAPVDPSSSARPGS